MVIAAAGDHWSYTEIEKGDVVSLDSQEDELEDNNYSADGDVLKLSVGQWSTATRYGSAMSVTDERAVREWIRQNFIAMQEARSF